jgi:hypothetical protein
MSYDDHSYHRERERHCRTMAKLARDPDIIRRHVELAELHADRAARYSAVNQGSQSAGAI